MYWIYKNHVLVYTNLIVDGDIRCSRKMKEKERFTRTHKLVKKRHSHKYQQQDAFSTDLVTLVVKNTHVGYIHVYAFC